MSLSIDDTRSSVCRQTHWIHYRETNYKQLFYITRLLLRDGELLKSLTPEQYIVIEKLIEEVDGKNGGEDGDDDDDNNNNNNNNNDNNNTIGPKEWKIWECFLMGKLKLKVDKAIEIAPIVSPVLPKKEEEYETDFTEIDLSNLQDEMNAYDFIGNLSLKLRYVLWGKPLDILSGKYTDLDNVQPLIDKLVQNNSSYLDNSVDNKSLPYVITSESSIENSEIIENGSVSSTVKDKKEDTDIDDNYDDDYDDDDDDDDEGKEEKQKEEGEKEGEVQDEQNNNTVSVDSQGFYTLDITISKKTLKKLKITNVDSIMEKFDTIYHSLENDKDTVLKRLKLQENDQLIERAKKRKLNSTENNNTDSTTNVNLSTTNRGNSNNNNTTKGNDNNNKDSTDSKEKKQPSSQFSLLSNLPIQHLLGAIEESREQIPLSDYELKHLLLDVRKSRSKWASDDKIGQEELYEACEKVVLELRNYTEHSTAFLNKVSKRDAPNYYNIIKKPMDLNTVLKKLKTFQYRSRQEFIDDLNLIWKNCFTYNSDPKHFLRIHALAMQKKSSNLIPHIPDIIIRDRNEIEKNGSNSHNNNNNNNNKKRNNNEQKNLENNVFPESKDEDYEDDGDDDDDEGDENNSNTSNNGMAKKTSKSGKGLSKNRRQSTMDDVVERSNAGTSKQPGSKENRPEKIDEFVNPQEKLEQDKEVPALEKEGGKEEDEQEEEEEEEEEEEDDEEEEEESDDDDDDGEGYSPYLTEHDSHKNDLELTLWKNLTSNARAEICIERSKLFDGYKLNGRATALLRNRKKMKLQKVLIKEFKDRKEIEIMNKKIKNNSILKNGFNSALLYDENDVDEEDDEEAKKSRNDQGVESSKAGPDKDIAKITDAKNDEGTEIEKQKAQEKDEDEEEEEEEEEEQINIDVDDIAFLNEYNVSNGLPTLKYQGISNDDMSTLEDALVSQQLDLLQKNHTQKKSCFLSDIDKGMNPKININIELTQQIRHVCHKIFLIRQLQTRQNMVPTKNNPNPLNFTPSLYRALEIDSNVDIDQISQLPTRNYKYSPQVSKAVLFKTSLKIAMNSGFESTEKSAIHMLNDISEDYLSNLIKTVKVHIESVSSNKQDLESILQVSLLQNGIVKPDDLYSYYEKEFTKKTKKLKSIKFKLNNFLKQLLRPSLKGLSERNFDDGGAGFVTGEYTSEITGEDFFGFKELGLDKEFAMLSKSIPLHLLAFQLSDKGNNGLVKDKKIQTDELEGITYHKLTKDDLDNKRFYPEIMKDFLTKQYEISKVVTEESENSTEEIVSAEDKSEDKNEDKSESVENSETANEPSIVIKSEQDAKATQFHILEDDELPNKPKLTKLPPTGKIAGLKKKLLKDGFFLPESLKIKLLNEKKALEKQKEEEEKSKSLETKINNSAAELNQSSEDISVKADDSALKLALPPAGPNRYGLTLPPKVTNTSG